MKACNVGYWRERVRWWRVESLTEPITCSKKGPSLGIPVRVSEVNCEMTDRTAKRVEGRGFVICRCRSVGIFKVAGNRESEKDFSNRRDLNGRE